MSNSKRQKLDREAALLSPFQFYFSLSAFKDYIRYSYDGRWD